MCGCLHGSAYWDCILKRPDTWPNFVDNQIAFASCQLKLKDPLRVTGPIFVCNSSAIVL